jgi:anti-sigma regulatory factor (Ser/Thr protein kinase)
MEIFEKSLEIKKEQAGSIVTIVPTWWKEISKQSGAPVTPGKLYAMGNYLVELVKNSLGDGKSDGKVTAIFDEDKIKIVIEDFGSEEKDISLNVGGNYGMKEAIEYADDFMVEAKGVTYEKDKYGRLEEVDESDIYTGSRTTFVKFNVAPPAEEDEPKFHGRDFNSRM